jgi:hypothetical protein
VEYQETLWSALYPGNRHSTYCLQPAVLAVESLFEFTPTQRRRVAWRLDGGFGSDENLAWLLARDYQVLAKGASNRRAEALARQVQRWDPAPSDCWLAWVPTPVAFERPVQTLVKRRLVKGQFRHSYYFSTLTVPSKTMLMQCYNDRGGAETEMFRADKSGLHLSHRRKHRMNAQEGLVLLTDLAHNLLADFEHRALAGTTFAGYGPKRIVRDLLAIPGQLDFEGGELKRIALLTTHPHAQELLHCLERYCNGV